MPKQPCLQRCTGVRTRGGNSGYGQPKGGQKGGLFPSIIIKTLILNIIVMDYGAPTRQNDFSNITLNQLLILVSVSKSGPESGPRTDKGTQLILHITAQKRKTNVQHHSQADDLWACFEVAKRRAFCHSARLRNHPARLKLVLSDSAIGSSGMKTSGLLDEFKRSLTYWM